MPKMNLGLSVAGKEVAEGYEAWPEDKLPQTGSYKGKLKILQISKTGESSAKYPNCPMLKVGVELVDAGVATGFTAFRQLLLHDDFTKYVNQFLRALTDGSDAELAKIQKAFETALVVDERQVNILKIGTYKVNSPEGNLPMLVSVKRGSYTPKGSTTPVANAQIQSFLLLEGGGGSGTLSGTAVAEEAVAEESEVEDVDLTDDSDEETETATESIFDDADESEEAEASA